MRALTFFSLVLVIVSLIFALITNLLVSRRIEQSLGVSFQAGALSTSLMTSRPPAGRHWATCSRSGRTASRRARSMSMRRLR